MEIDQKRAFKNALGCAFKCLQQFIVLYIDEENSSLYKDIDEENSSLYKDIDEEVFKYTLTHGQLFQMSFNSLVFEEG
jgi:hypothetical protein